MPVYTFNTNVPLQDQQIDDSQPILLQNNLANDELINVNHVGYNISDSGKHKFVQFPFQIVDPTTQTYELAQYTILSTLTGLPEMVIRRESNGAVVEYTSSTASANGWTRLPSNILIKWGSVTVTPPSVTATFPTGGTIPAFTSLFQVVVSPESTGTDPNTFVYVKTPLSSTTSFDVVTSQRTTTSGPVATTFTYLAIGV